MKKLSRKYIRYALFRKRDDLPRPDFLSKKEWKELLTHYSSQDGFTDWSGFALEWDVGIDDDVRAAKQRVKDYFWCKGYTSEQLVANPYSKEWKAAKRAHAKFELAAAQEGSVSPKMPSLQEIMGVGPSALSPLT